MTGTGGTSGSADEVDAACPFCDSEDVEREMDFGQEISKSQYYCNACETPFERIKWGDDRRVDTGR